MGARCGLEDAAWRAVLERAPRATAATLVEHASDAAIEVVRLVRLGHGAAALVDEWAELLPADVRPLVAAHLGVMAEGLAQLVERVKGPADLPAAVAWVEEFTALWGRETAVMPPLPGARESVTKGRR